MVAGHIISLAVLYDSAPFSKRCAGPTMMINQDVRESGGGPSEHVGLDVVESIRSGTNPQTAHRIPAVAFVNFGATAHVKNWVRLERPHAGFLVIEHASADAQARIFIEFQKSGGKVIGSK